jgi:hypothetical protein
MRMEILSSGGVRTKAFALGALLSILLSASFAIAGPIITFTTPANSALDNLPVSAEAIFTLGNGTITIGLVNLQANPKSVIQNISDLYFTVDSWSGSTASLSSSTGLERNVAHDSSYTDLSGASTGWKLDIVVGNKFHLDGLGATYTPAHTIIGPADASGKYGNANSSIAGNNPHNPFLFGTEEHPVTFTLNIPGVTEGTKITDVIFSFGTAAGNNVPSVSSVPEPGTLLLLSVGLTGIYGYRLRKRGKK